MLTRIQENISRQHKGLVVLLQLLEEEFSLLSNHNPQAVTGCEFSIQELMRQLAVEKLCLRKLVTQVVPEATNMKGLLDALPKEQTEDIRLELTKANAVEQRCAIQAEKNGQMVFALAEQNKKLYDFIHAKIQPEGAGTYSYRGKVSSSRPEAVVFRGRS